MFKGANIINDVIVISLLSQRDYFLVLNEEL